MSTQLEDYPPFLQNYGSLLSHFNGHFSDLNSGERGERFVQFAKRLIPHTAIGERFEVPHIRQRSHDQGVDLEAESKDKKEILSVQSKYTIKDIDELDRIFSKFATYHQAHLAKATNDQAKPVQQGLFDAQEADEDNQAKMMHFMIITTGDLVGLLPKYEHSRRPSVTFYNTIKQEKRFHIADGPRLVPILQKTYRKLHIIPSDFEVTFAKGYIHHDDVYVGIVSCADLAALYDLFGDALFIENIREFLGSIDDRASLTDVNKDILATLEAEPEKFLAKNNGITFRAGTVREIDDGHLRLIDASIVNGLQTTMSIVQQPTDKGFVLVKIVGTGQYWEIAKAANFQNKVDRIDLDLAEFIRPRRIRTAATKVGVQFQYRDEEFGNIFAVLDTIYEDRISYQEIRSLFIGIFSRNPNNTIDPDYNQLRTDIIEKMYEEDGRSDKIFSILFSVQKLIQTGAAEAQRVFKGKDYADVFHRFWEEAKPSYRAFLAILAMCGCVRQNIYDGGGNFTLGQMLPFLGAVENIVESQPEVFIRYFRHSFKSVAMQIIGKGSDRDITLQNLNRSMHRAKFSPLYTTVCINADDDDYLANLKPTS
jgi:hypothetical protein